MFFYLTAQHTTHIVRIVMKLQSTHTATGAGISAAQTKAKTWQERARDSRLFTNYCNAHLTAALTTDARHERRNLLAVAAIGELIAARGGNVPQPWQIDVFGKYMGEGAIK
jgi:hypothetical protein